ncbi:MAG: hypothetical protein E6Q97_27645 [Desulfurellales bacterium]|nr:MAG: hypothetical protein E6Q97_27645 [Desulfurellales bacterium]
MTTPRRTPRETPVADPHATLLTILGARAPSNFERQSLIRLARGQASDGEQKAAMMYVLTELAGAGRSAFDLDPRVSEFRSGARGVGLAIAAIAQADVLRFGAVQAKTEENG